MTLIRSLRQSKATFLALPLLLAASLSLAPYSARAQIPGIEDSSTSNEPSKPAADPYGRENPRSAVTGLLDALAADDFDRAAHYFAGVPDARASAPEPAVGDEANTPAQASRDTKAAAKEADARERFAAEVEAKYTQSVATGADLARRLKSALDRGGSLLPFGALSSAPTGKIDDGLEPDRERVGSLGGAFAGSPILLNRTERPDGTSRWLIAAETTEIITAAPAPEVDDVPGEREQLNVAGAPLIDWIKLLAIALGSFFAFRMLASGILMFLRRLLNDPEASAFYRVLFAGLPPLALYFAVLTFYLTADSLEVAIVARQTLLRYAGIVAWVALAWFVLRIIDGAARITTARMHRAERRQAVSIISFLRRGAKFLVLAIAAIAVFDTVGLDVTTGIAALGIGGLALALGAQKTIENLVGSLSIIADKPVQVGDRAKIGDVFGTVENIGMRSSRIRTNQRTLVTIPNGDLAAQRIENFDKRDRFLFHQTLGVSYDTDAAAMERVLGMLRALLRDSENIIDDEARVRFHGFGDSALDIEIFAYFRAKTYPQSLEMQEELLLAIMRKLNELGIEIAFPTQTLLVRSDNAG